MCDLPTHPHPEMHTLTYIHIYVNRRTHTLISDGWEKKGEDIGSKIIKSKHHVTGNIKPCSSCLYMHVCSFTLCILFIYSSVYDLSRC